MLKISTATPNQVRLLLMWAEEEGWNPGLSDHLTFQSADPSGFFIGTLNGEPVGGISNVRYGRTFSFLGLYITRAEFRGQGYGIQLWRHAMCYAGKRNCGLDGVLLQQPNYQKSGFRLAYRNIRFVLDNPILLKNMQSNVISTNAFPLKSLITYDRRFFPAPRTPWFVSWLLNNQGLIYVESGQILGLGVIRPCKIGYKIGPLYAETLHIADSIYTALSHLAKSHHPIYLDVPEPNKKALKWVESLGMKPVFETARMYTGPTPKLNLNKIFGVSTFELG